MAPPQDMAKPLSSGGFASGRGCFKMGKILPSRTKGKKSERNSPVSTTVAEGEEGGGGGAQGQEFPCDLWRDHAGAGS